MSPVASPRRRAMGAALFLLAALFASGGNLQAAPVSREYQIKAAFLYNFAQFVQWPESAFEDAEAPLVVGILGQDPFGSFLDAMLSGEKIAGRPIVVRRFSRPEEIQTCHLLFVSESESRRLERVLGGLKTRSVLTVGEGRDFPRRGGMFGLLTLRGKVRFQVNLDAVKGANLNVSSKLLRLAEIVP